jgi:hypothetical protein
MSYIISSLCFGNKYEPIKSHWLSRINERCSIKKSVHIFDNTNISFDEIPSSEYAWWDVVRLKKNISLCLTENKPIIHIDMDIIIEKELDVIVNLPYDFIISTEIGGNQSFPKECSEKLGFGVCSGFYIIKPNALLFMMSILNNMTNKKYNSYSDQVNIMNYIVNNKYEIKEEVCIFNGLQFKNKIIKLDAITICVLDFEIITRDPIVVKNQFGNHINVDNVGGVENFIKYFYEPLESLPLTCRCNKHHLGDYNTCKHIDMRNAK